MTASVMNFPPVSNCTLTSSMRRYIDFPLTMFTTGVGRLLTESSIIFSATLLVGFVEGCNPFGVSIPQLCRKGLVKCIGSNPTNSPIGTKPPFHVNLRRCKTTDPCDHCLLKFLVIRRRFLDVSIAFFGGFDDRMGHAISSPTCDDIQGIQQCPMLVGRLLYQPQDVGSMSFRVHLLTVNSLGGSWVNVK
jgi:hypothetical protein